MSVALTQRTLEETALLLAHYERVGPLLEASLGFVPLVAISYPHGDEMAAAYTFALQAPPATIATVGVPRIGANGTAIVAPYLGLTTHGMLWAVHRYGASAFGTWAPTEADPEAVRFARIVVSPGTHGGLAAVEFACLALRAGFEARGLRSVVLLDGLGGAALWFPLDDARPYDIVRGFFHDAVRAIAAAHPAVMTADRLHAHAPERVHVNASTIAVDRFTDVPYALTATHDRAIVTPIRWEELGRVRHATVSTCAARLAAAGDVFAGEVARIGQQRLPHDAGVPVMLAPQVDHGRVLAAVRALLADGYPHDADSLCAEAIARGLLPATTLPHYVRNSIMLLIDRATTRGTRPEFLALPDGRFRANVPIDPFPSFAEIVVPDAAIEALATRLQASAIRDVPAEAGDGPNIGAPFERDVAAAFATLGFLAERRGGQGDADVVAVAALGDDQFSVAIECKTASRQAQTEHNVTDSYAEEAGRMRDGAHATYALLLGPAFGHAQKMDDELALHRVALWTVDDLCAVLRAHALHPVPWTAYPELFAPGRAAERVSAFCFAHIHGTWQRARVAYRAVLEEGLAYADSLAAADPDAERGPAPLTVEALAVLVNTRLARGRDLGRVSVADVRAAVAYGAHPMVGTIAEYGERVVITARVAR